MMRIALIASSLRLAGAEKQFVYMARALNQPGVDVRVFYLGPGDHYQNVLRAAGIRICQIYSQRPLYILGGLLRQLWKFKPHVTLASQFGDLLFAGPAGRCRGGLLLGGVRSDGFYELRTAGVQRGLLLRLPHGLISNSARAQANLVSQGVDSSRIAVLPNVIDLFEFDRGARSGSEYSAPDGRITITGVGSLQPCKRFERILSALALARRREPALFGVIAGEDLGVRAELEHKAKTLGLLPGHVRFLGRCDHIPGLLARSRVFTLCSDYEGFPNVILEAMAAGLPVITTPAGDAGRIVADGVTGFVVQPDDVHHLADCLVRLAHDPALAMQMGAAGRKRAEEQYDFSLLASRLLAVIHGFARKHRKDSVLKAMSVLPAAPVHPCRSVPGPGAAFSRN